MPRTKPYKALVALVVSFIAALWASIAGKGDDLADMTGPEWVAVILGALVVAAGTYATPNPPVTGSTTTTDQ